MLAKRVLVILIVMGAFLASYESIIARAAGDFEEKSICTVIVNSKMRSTPSRNGSQVASIPEGAFVVLTGVEGDFFKAEYGNFSGYIYRGCISVSKKVSFEEYAAQFPELNLGDDINKKPSVADRTINEKLTQSDESVRTQTNRRNERMNLMLAKRRRAEAPLPEEGELDKLVAGDDSEAGRESVSDNSASDNGVKEHKGDDKGTGVSGNDVVTPSDNSVSNNDAGDDNKIPAIAVEYRSIQNAVPGVAQVKVKVRSLPTTESSHIDSIPADAKVEILDEGDNGFLHIRYNGKEGYAFARCIAYEKGAFGEDKKTEEPPKPVESDEKEERTPSELLAKARNANSQSAILIASDTASYETRTRTNMRSLPTSDSAKLSTLPIGVEITILGQSGGYALVEYNGVQGYVLESCLVDSSAIEKVGIEPVLFNLTGYCPCQKCCGNFSPEVRGGEPRTSTGATPVEGRTIAVDPSVIPYGSIVNIEGLGTFVAEDCGGKVDGLHIDVYFDNHEDAWAFGRKQFYVTIGQ